MYHRIIIIHNTVECGFLWRVTPVINNLMAISYVIDKQKSYTSNCFFCYPCSAIVQWSTYVIIVWKVWWCKLKESSFWLLVEAVNKDCNMLKVCKLQCQLAQTGSETGSLSTQNHIILRLMCRMARNECPEGWGNMLIKSVHHPYY